MRLGQHSQAMPFPAAALAGSAGPPSHAPVGGEEDAFLGVVAAPELEGDEGVAVVVKSGDGHEVIFGGVGRDGVRGRPGQAAVVGAHELGAGGPLAGDLVSQPDRVAPRGDVRTLRVAQEDARLGGDGLGRVERPVLARGHVEAVVGLPHEHHGVACSIQHQAGAFVAKRALGDVEGFGEVPGDLGLEGSCEKAPNQGECGKVGGRAYGHAYGDINRAGGTSHPARWQKSPKRGRGLRDGGERIFAPWR